MIEDKAYENTVESIRGEILKTICPKKEVVASYVIGKDINGLWNFKTRKKGSNNRFQILNGRSSDTTLVISCIWLDRRAI